MRLLLKSAIRNAKHLTLAIVTLFTLLGFTVVNLMEIQSLAILANTGADFFTLFGKEDHKKVYATDSITLEAIQNKWKKIDKDNKGVITKHDASTYLAKRKDPNILNKIFRKVLSKFDLSRSFMTLIMLLLFIASIKAVFLFFSRYTTQILSIRVTKDLRQQYFEHIQSQPMSFYQEHNLGSLASRAVGDAGQIASSLNSCLTNYFQTPFTLVSTLLLCFYTSWQLSLIIFVAVPLVIYPIVVLTRRVKKVGRQLQKNQEMFTSILLDFLSGIQTIKIYAMEGFSLEKFKEQNDKMAMLETKSAKYALLIRPILHTVTTVSLASVALFGLYTLHLTLAELVVFCGYLHIFYEPVKKLAEENANIQKGVVAAERMYEVMDLKPSIQDIKGADKLTNFNDEIVFDDVWFKYQDNWVLKGVSFTVQKGQTVAIIGPTGAGKSTIVQLLVRLYEVQKGQILINGKPLVEYTQKSLREAISYVPQNPFLFYDTVAENIAFGKKFPRDEIIKAAIKAHADEFIQELPNKYDTLLAEMGKSLSGGQRQRLAIARALVKNGDILVMDEATSSLDAISEKKIKEAVINLHGELTQILIAHRLSTIEHADKIIYLDHGCKIAEGSFEYLLENCMPFKVMWETYRKTSKALN